MTEVSTAAHAPCTHCSPGEQPKSSPKAPSQSGSGAPQSLQRRAGGVSTERRGGPGGVAFVRLSDVPVAPVGRGVVRGAAAPALGHLGRRVVLADALARDAAVVRAPAVEDDGGQGAVGILSRGLASAPATSRASEPGYPPGGRTRSRTRPRSPAPVRSVPALLPPPVAGARTHPVRRVAGPAGRGVEGLLGLLLRGVLVRDGL